MLDINFLLIMFFMLTAQFQRTTQSAVDLPKEQGEKEAQIDEAGLVINITSRGEIIVSNETVDLEALRGMVREQIDKQPAHSKTPLKLMVRADRKAGTDQLNRVVVMLRDLGVGTIRIATEVPI
jgi:biopolymer transport protein ExbD